MASMEMNFLLLYSNNTLELWFFYPGYRRYKLLISNLTQIHTGGIEKPLCHQSFKTYQSKSKHTGYSCILRTRCLLVAR